MSGEAPTTTATQGDTRIWNIIVIGSRYKTENKYSLVKPFKYLKYRGLNTRNTSTRQMFSPWFHSIQSARVGGLFKNCYLKHTQTLVLTTGLFPRTVYKYHTICFHLKSMPDCLVRSSEFFQPLQWNIYDSWAKVKEWSRAFHGDSLNFIF